MKTKHSVILAEIHTDDDVWSMLNHHFGDIYFGHFWMNYDAVVSCYASMLTPNEPGAQKWPLCVTFFLLWVTIGVVAVLHCSQLRHFSLRRRC